MSKWLYFQDNIVNATFWTPAELGSLVLWLDAMDENSVVHSIDNVITQLQDKSTANNHFYPVTGIPTPLYSLSNSISNNKPAIVFPDDGNARFVQATSAFNLKEVFYVCAYKDGLASTFARYDALLSGTKAYGEPRIIGDLNTNSIRLDNTKFGDYIYKNGSTTSSITVLPMPLSILRVKSNTLHNYAWVVGGTYGYANVNHWKGVICEVIGFSSNLTADEAQKIEGYLAHKWELTDKLPSEHPYKSSLPTV